MDLLGGEEAGVTGLAASHAGPGDGLTRLVALAQSGDTRAFEALVKACQGRVLRFAMKLLMNPEDARDASQEVLVRFFKYLPSLVRRLSNVSDKSVVLKPPHFPRGCRP